MLNKEKYHLNKLKCERKTIMRNEFKIIYEWRFYLIENDKKKLVGTIDGGGVSDIFRWLESES